ncbi:MAG: CCA tRNA nucleotidyltransferase, partial [Methylocella sp.]
MSQAETGRRGIEAPEALAVLFDDKDLLAVFAALDQVGEETRIVGGALRNTLLGRPAHEIDLATTHLPEAVMARATTAGLRVVPTGVAHGTVTVLAGERTFEVTTLREDIATDGRHAKVRFGRSFETDALRRDFTMNALSMTRDGTLFDYTCGLGDIAARRVRFIGEPARRIAEDYLRILRFFRFSADFGEGLLDSAGRLAAIRQKGGLARLSRERVRVELLKLLSARQAARVCADICADGLLHPLIACVPNPARLRRVAAIVPPQDPLLRLAALCVELPEDAARLRERLRLSNAEAERLEGAAIALVTLHGLN